MQLHPGVYRNHNPAVFERFGRDKGADIPLPCEYVHALRPLLDEVKRGSAAPADDAWALWSELGTLSRRLFGPPSFHPIVMPGTGTQRTR